MNSITTHLFRHRVHYVPRAQSTHDDDRRQRNDTVHIELGERRHAGEERGYGVHAAYDGKRTQVNDRRMSNNEETNR